MLNLNQGFAKTLKVGRRIFNNVYVELDLEGNTINCYIPERSEKDYLGKITKKDIKGVSLENLILLNGYRAETLENLLVVSYAPSGSLHIGKTLLNVKFNLLKNEKVPYGLIPIKLFPEKGYIILESDTPDDYMEILIEGFYLSTEPPIAFQKLLKNFSLEVRPVIERGIISFVFLNKQNNLYKAEDVETLAEGLEVALSFVQGKEVYRKLIQYNSRVKINFKGQGGDKQVLPTIPTRWYVTKEYKSYPFDEFLTKFLVYWIKLNKEERLLFKRLILSIVYAKTKQLITENKLLNLMLAYELLKSSKTLDKTSLKETLNITSCEAYFIVNIRDNIMHGHTFEDAVKIAFEKLKKEKDCKGTSLETIGNLSMEDKVIHAYFALIYYLEMYILRKIKYSGPYYNPLNSFTEEIVNEILIEDEDIIDELARR